MKKYINKIFIIIVLIIMILPFIFMNKDIQGISKLENRKLNKLPELDASCLSEPVRYFEGINNWYTDHVGFRDNMMKLNARFLMKYFRKSASKDVILGKEDWLFYNGEKGVSINEYMAKSLYNEDELKLILNNLEGLKSWCDNYGINLVLMIIPDKEHVYSRYMPDDIHEFNKQKNVDLVCDYIKKNSDINLIYLKDDLERESYNRQVFQKYDSHWNDYGAYIGYKAIQSALNKQARSFDEFSPKEYEALSGDLAGMTLVNDMFASYTDYEIDDSKYSECLYESDKGSRYSIFNNSGKYESIFFMGDSFRERLMKFLNYDYKKAFFVHRYEQNFADVLKEKPDILVYQLVERYVDELKTGLSYDSCN